MKKLVCVLIVVALCLIAGPVMAAFKVKDNLFQDVRKEIGAFYQRNEGNKITIDIMDGLMLHLNQIFEQNVIKEVEEAKPKALPKVLPNKEK